MQYSKIGYVKDLETYEIEPLRKFDFQPSVTLLRNINQYQQYDHVNFILSLNNDLSMRYTRALHWFRNSNYETNKQVKTLFLWFSLEALFKQTEKDNISGKVRIFVGFPRLSNSKFKESLLVKELKQHPSYEFWFKKFPVQLDMIREFRNESVHAGFRAVELTKENLNFYCNILEMTVPRCLNAVNVALLNDIDNIDRFVDNMADLFEKAVNKNDIHGTFIYSLDKYREKLNLG
ncbi:MAG: hypothetical protein KBC57_13780 [Neisseriaceae bacterium]|nr:hypothetical protein [Neisseriaceae bacterium]